MKYTKEALETIVAEGDGTILDTYDRYNQRMRVRFRCSCGAETSKRFEMLNLYRLPYCEPCSLKKATERSKATIMKNYGVENAGQAECVKKKIKDIFNEKYGMHPKKTKEVQDKWTATCIEKFGGHPNQNKEVQVRSEATSYHYKTYMMPSGNLVKYQGYEDKALDELVQLYEEEDICIGRANIPSIDYQVDDKKHVYFPDFYIKSENKIIEVKSEWTIQLRRGNVEEKALATVKAGYKYEIWVYSDKKIKVETKMYG
ncbi:MAG: hypothetical protein EB127_26285 [Alphaproteobacteria bacterium]|nr:hypothetical protein [Alphaproteobacteria bacterium]